LLAEAEREGRLKAHHLACAEALAAHGRFVEDARIGRHLLAAGRLNEAVDLLLAGAEGRGDQYAILEVLGLAEQALERADLPFDDPRWGATWARRSGLCTRAGRYEEGEAWARRAIAGADQHGWPAARARATIELAVIALHQRRRDGPTLTDEAVAAAEAYGDPHGVARARYVRAAAAMELRDWALDEVRYQTALEAYEALDDEAGRADCLRDLGNLALMQGQLFVASKNYLAALALFRVQGATLGEAHARNGLADVARQQGDLEAAESGYRDALRLFERVGAGQATLARLNLGLVLLATSKWIEAREVVEGCRSWLAEQGRDTWLGAACAVLLPAYAGTGAWVEFDRACRQAELLLSSTEFVQPDILAVAERAVEMATAAQQPERAANAQRIVNFQVERLGRR
jgi:tetratricopeptide (TPR) repeat protein